MKNTRRFISAVMTLAMVSAIAPMSAFADTTVNQASDPKTGTMTATYDVTAKYTMTIPAGVTLSSTDAVPASIEASGVMLESGQKIKVTLTSADHTESGSTFHAQTEKGDSTATYTIGKGEATTGISVGDTVAEFTENGTQKLSFSTVSGATYAGEHTETLTFGISVEDAVSVTYKIIGNAVDSPSSLPANFTEVTLEEATAYGQSFTDTAAWLIIYAKDGSNYKFVANSPEKSLFNGTNTWDNIVYGESGIYHDPEQVSIIAPVTE